MQADIEALRASVATAAARSADEMAIEAGLIIDGTIEKLRTDVVFSMAAS